MTDARELPDAVVAPRKHWSVQLVWVIPIVAALIGGWLAFKAITERGPTITITFRTAEGLEAGKTKIKYKDVEIGQVTAITLAEDRKNVVVTAELTKQAESFLVEDTRFWVVRARIAGGQVSGLGTLLSGSYIGVDIGRSKEERRAFTGLDVQPIVTGDLPGRRFLLKADDHGSLDVGAPVYFRRLQVGEVVAGELDKDGKGVSFTIFVHAPYDEYVTQNTRFWNASGIDVSFDATGLNIRTQSLVSILVGGVAFQAPPDGGVVARGRPERGLRPVPDPRRGDEAAGHGGGELRACFRAVGARPLGRCPGRFPRRDGRRGDAHRGGVRLGQDPFRAAGGDPLLSRPPAGALPRSHPEAGRG